MTEIIKVDVQPVIQGEVIEFETYDRLLVPIGIAMIRERISGTKQGTDIELTGFIRFCIVNKADPFSGQAFFIKYGKDDPPAYVLSYHVYVDRAGRHPAFNGMEMGVVWRTDGQKVLGQPCDHEFDDTHQVVGGWARVWRKDREKPFYREVPNREMVKKKRDGNLVRSWDSQFTTMAMKVPLCRALRDAFPEELGSTYAEGELLPTADSESAVAVRTREQRKALPEQTPLQAVAEKVRELLAGKVLVVEDEMVREVMLYAAVAATGSPADSFDEPDAWSLDVATSVLQRLDETGIDEAWLPKPTESEAENVPA